jgi:hypothetical protein
MRTSETLSDLAAALATAQGEMSNATLNKTNPHFRSKYADLAAVREATIPVLSKHGLSLVQMTGFDADGTFLLTTRLLHASGQWMESVYPLPLMPDKPQVMGSAISYSKRYSWTGMCGIASEEDDDGNHAQEGAKSAPKNGGGRIADKTGAWEARKDDRFAPNAAARKSSAAAKRDGDWATMEHDMMDAKSAVSMQRLWDDYRQTKYPVWNKDWQREADELFAHKLAQFSKGDDLRETLEDSAAEVAAPTDVQIDAYRERAAWLSAAKTPDDLTKRAKNPEHAIEVNKLTEGQKRNLRELYQDTKAKLQAELMAAL